KVGEGDFQDDGACRRRRSACRRAVPERIRAGRWPMETEVLRSAQSRAAGPEDAQRALIHTVQPHSFIFSSNTASVRLNCNGVTVTYPSDSAVTSLSGCGSGQPNSLPLQK